MIGTHIQPFISHHDLCPAVTVRVTNGYIHEYYKKRIFLVSFRAREFMKNL